MIRYAVIMSIAASSFLPLFSMEYNKKYFVPSSDIKTWSNFCQNMFKLTRIAIYGGCDGKIDKAIIDKAIKDFLCFMQNDISILIKKDGAVKHVLNDLLLEAGVYSLMTNFLNKNREAHEISRLFNSIIMSVQLLQPVPLFSYIAKDGSKRKGSRYDFELLKFLETFEQDREKNQDNASRDENNTFVIAPIEEKDFKGKCSQGLIVDYFKSKS